MECEFNHEPGIDLSEFSHRVDLVANRVAIAVSNLFTRTDLWRGERVLGESLLWVLHLGYLWIVAGMAFLAASAAGWGSPGMASFRAVTAGTMGTMTLGVKSRAVLGHGGYELRAGPALTGAFTLVSLAAAGRAGG